MSKIIRIDTSNNKKIFVTLINEDKKIEVFLESALLKSEVCLPLIENLLKKNKINIEEIDAIEVNEGPGSFTGLRVGAAIANAFSYLLKIPVNKKKIGELTIPVYNS